MTEIKLYAVVHFLNENAVEPVPSSWMVDNETAVLWPLRYSDAAIYKARLNRESPNPVTWQKVPARKLGGASAVRCRHSNLTEYDVARLVGRYLAQVSDREGGRRNRNKSVSAAATSEARTVPGMSVGESTSYVGDTQLQELESFSL